MNTLLILFKHFSQYSIIALISFLSFSPINAQDRAVWATVWEINTPEKIDKMLSDINKHHFNKLFIQVRYRGDAIYIPNKTDSTYINTEKRCYILRGSNFDPLEYTILKAKPLGIKVYAWVTTFVITPHDLTKIDSSHIFYTKSDWLLRTKSGKMINYNEYEGAFIDPANTEARQYTLNILADIVSNYKIDGLQLDYIRYPDTIYGWNNESLKLKDSVQNFNFDKWKQQKVTSFVNLTYITLKNINPSLEISAAVIGDKIKAGNKYSQYWWSWTDQSIIDKVYVMAYNTSNNSFLNLIKQYDMMPNKQKMTIILRSWQDDKPYHVSQINNKLSFLKAHGFYDIGFYNYSGLIEYKYLEQIKF